MRKEEELDDNEKKVYNFYERLRAAAKEWNKCYKDIMKLGYKSENGTFSIEKVNERTRAVHIIFPSDIMQLLPQLLTHSDILKRMNW